MHAATREPAPPSAEGTERSPATVELGRVQRPHGLDGGFLVLLYGDDPANLLAAPEVLLCGEPGEIPFRTRAAEDAGSGRERRARVRLWLEGITDRERAERWSGARLAIGEHLLESLPEGEFYWRDLIGASCRLPDGTVLGTLEEIWPTAGHDVLVVRDGGRTRLLAATDEVLVRLERTSDDTRVLTLDPPEGSLDDASEAGS